MTSPSLLSRSETYHTSVTSALVTSMYMSCLENVRPFIVLNNAVKNEPISIILGN